MSFFEKIIIPLVLISFIIAVFAYTKTSSPAAVDTTSEDSTTEEIEQAATDSMEVHAPDTQAFKRFGLETDTSKTSVDLNEIVSGGPGKDGIPAISNPKFTSIDDVSKNLTDDIQGILVTVGDTSRFYPYNILVWHELVNDVVDDTPLLISFCPLCGSAIVFDPTIDGESREFGVSGLLIDSNLIMYDKKTESLWSQIVGEAIVGEALGHTLDIYPSQLLSFAQVKEHYPEAEILSEDTGTRRNYGRYPYADYDTNENYYFPVKNRDTRLPGKQIMYAINVDNYSIAFHYNNLIDQGKALVTLPNDTQIEVQVENDELTARFTNDPTGRIIPGYFAMWFSWASAHQDNGIVWE